MISASSALEGFRLTGLKAVPDQKKKEKGYKRLETERIILRGLTGRYCLGHVEKISAQDRPKGTAKALATRVRR
jgi:hypothetical protein